VGLAVWLSAFVYFLRQFVRPPRLILDDKGFTFTGRIGSPLKVSWLDIDEFFVVRPARGDHFIAYKLKLGTGPSSRLDKVRSLGADGKLPSIWPMSAESVADKLNAVRQAQSH
jgi:hypothetical protein